MWPTDQVKFSKVPYPCAAANNSCMQSSAVDPTHPDGDGDVIANQSSLTHGRLTMASS